MVSINQKLDTLVRTLSRTDDQTIGSTVNKVANVMKADSRLIVAETWVCGSVGKGTNIKGQSDIDLVFLLSHKQEISSEDTLFKLIRSILKNISDITPVTPFKATKISVSGIEVDVLITQFGTHGRIGEAQYSKKHVEEILNEGTLFTNTARIIKYWKIIPENTPKKGYISSFDIEVILGYVFKHYKTNNYLNALISFFNYVVESELNDQLAFPPSGEALVHRSFDFKGKQHFISLAKHAQKCLNQNPPILSFLNLS